MKIFSIFLCLPLVFGFSNLKSIQKSRPTTKLFGENPSDIIRDISRFGAGKEWTYQEFLDNIKDKNIDKASVLSDQKGNLSNT